MSAFTTNDPSPSAAAANAAALTKATGDTVLPRGTLYISSPVVHTAKNSGLRLLGNETEIKNTSENGHALLISGHVGNFSYDEQPRKIPAGQVGFLFHWDGDPSNPWFYRDPGRVRYVGKPPEGSAGLTLGALLRRSQVVPDMPAGTDRFPLTVSGVAPPVGSVVRISDGQWINALTFDVRRVIAYDGRTVILDRGVSRDFANAAACFPQEPTHIHYEGLTFTANDGPVQIQGCSHITFADCVFSRSPFHPSNRSFTTPIQCAYIDFIRCRFDGRLHFGTSHDCNVYNCSTNWLSGEEDAHDIRVIGGTLGDGSLDASVNSHSWSLAGVKSTAAGIFAYDSWFLSRMTNEGGPITLRGARAQLDHVDTDGPVLTEAGWQGSYPTSGQDIRLESVRYASFVQGAGTTVERVDCEEKEPK